MSKREQELKTLLVAYFEEKIADFIFFLLYFLMFR